MDLLILGGIGLVLVATLLYIAGMYRIVPADYADVVIQGSKIRVFCADKQYSTENKAAYFRIPSWFFIANKGMKVHRIPLSLISIDVNNFLAFDQDRARFMCDIIAYVSVKNPMVAAQRFSGDIKKMSGDVKNVVQATTRDATTKKKIRQIINDREGIIKTIEKPLKEALDCWGLDLKDIELIEFKDPEAVDDIDVDEFGNKKIIKRSSHVISDISSIIEEEINSEARQKNAEQIKHARVKEAENEELAKKREIEKEESIAIREQEKVMVVAEKQKEAREKELEVEKVVQVKNAQIQKEKSIVEANQRKEVEEIQKEQKKLEGEGEKLRLQEKARGDAESIRQNGLAEAEAKERLQEALNKFGDKAIRALIAEKEVERDKAIGIAVAQALANAEVRVLSGGANNGFDLGALVESISTSSPTAGQAILNKLARDKDLGFTELAPLLEAALEKKQKSKQQKPETPETPETKQQYKKPRGKTKKGA